MEWYTALITIIGLFFVLLALGIPVNYSLGLSFHTDLVVPFR